jgi:hypothetical protein
VVTELSKFIDWPETGFETINVQLNDHTDRGSGGRQYGKSKGVETPKG